MSFDKYGMSGEGTIEEYFHTPADVTGDLPDELREELEERDSAIDRLCVQLFADFSGLDKSDRIEVFWPEDEEEVPAKGLVLVGIQPDDPILALFKDGQPVAAFYASYRGMYQAGGYVVEGDKHFFASDFADQPWNTWLEHETICSEIARDFVLGHRTR